VKPSVFLCHISITFFWQYGWATNWKIKLDFYSIVSTIKLFFKAFRFSNKIFTIKIFFT